MPVRKPRLTDSGSASEGSGRRILRPGGGPLHFRHLETSYEEKLAFLRDPDNYPEPPEPFQSIETHMAWVYLTRDHAFKFKKPLFRPGQDYASIDSRYRDHRIELLLNRRLAEDTYLDLVPLQVDENGRMQIGGPGCSCDWLLRMRRLPAERMLDELLSRRKATEAHAVTIGTRLGHFYAAGHPVSISFQEHRERFSRGIELNLSILTREGVLRELATHVSELQRRFLNSYGTLLDDCLREGRFMECHGDLRPEHICLQDQVRIIDCLQFQRDHRLMDFYDDLAFLALECERLGAADFGKIIVTEVQRVTSHTVPGELLRFYQSYRAVVRARLALLHLLYGTSNDREKWLRKTRSYLDHATIHIDSALGR
ncbi:hypothetical protein ACXYTJ_16425 [Gilvimarinus sp. F26214L]|uniref:hypothetical protein n=1 Tax=Gilvimarinus sp. DZF01 TaxID=3461371 RepID=UPI00404679A5